MKELQHANNMKRSLSIFFFLYFSIQCSLFAQTNNFQTKKYYPKDSLLFRTEVGEVDYNYQKEQYGKTTMIIHCQSAYGTFDFVFKKKILKLSRIVEFQNGAVGETYNIKTKKWDYDEDTHKYNEMKGKPLDTIIMSEHELYAFVLLHDQGTVQEKIKFQDFGNQVYWPEFDYPFCSVSDENKDGIPEFYLSYMGNSDGLDPKPFKQIIYTFTNTDSSFLKAKTTAFYPVEEEDVYHIEYDSNWKKLPAEIQKKSSKLLADHKKMDPMK